MKTYKIYLKDFDLPMSVVADASEFDKDKAIVWFLKASERIACFERTNFIGFVIE